MIVVSNFSKGQTYMSYKGELQKLTKESNKHQIKLQRAMFNLIQSQLQLKGVIHC